ncbi:hypothetical protein F3Y22_tig00000916pilonHSYRG00343 [Hibiscus syriacus]|uniref:BRCT domain-containing protein n=1 Tax=Hibiscus syriacus TaxID=106335 RepID=A0A6A3CX97_HIBSY|nr:hypothetical protein F3Y22_tig00000916pilonHSYRG00343 [Hibiscus syriacus]
MNTTKSMKSIWETPMKSQCADRGAFHLTVSLFFPLKSYWELNKVNIRGSLNGRPVTGDESFSSNIIHVHSSFIEWAPQVYYVGDSIKNLKAELARGAKLNGQLKFNTLWGQPENKKDWVFCGSALSPEEKFLLIKFAKMIGVIVTKFWRSDVTHVIASTDENGACTRTLKVLMAISNGKWVLNINCNAIEF